ncbi:MAG: GAF domain-containing protein, partial [Anaerolineales bacterium]|nr:GAF domain-containing protein [Anaerolineales bacterium]
MSKKKINNRLDKLFDTIKEEENITKKQQPQKNGRVAVRKPAQKKPNASGKDTANLNTKVLDSAVVDAHAAVQVNVAEDFSVMSLPLRIDEESWATLQVIDDGGQPRQWDEEEQLLVKQVADQLSLALENARLFQETQEQSEEQALINEIVTTITGSLDTDENLRFIASHLQKIAGSYHVSATIPDYKNMTAAITSYQFDKAGTQTFRDVLQLQSLGITTAIRESGGPVVVEDLANNPTAVAIKNSFLNRKIQSTVVFPLMAGNDLLGLMSVDYLEKKPGISQKNIDLISTILLQASTSIQRANLYLEAQKRTEELTLINSIVGEVSRKVELAESLQLITEGLAKAVSAHHVGIALLDESAEYLSLVADAPLNKADLGLTIPFSGITKEVMETKKPAMINDVRTDERTANIKDLLLSRGTLSLAIFPLLSGEDAIGSVGVDFAETGRSLDQGEMRLIETILLQASTSVETARLFTQMEESEARFRDVALSSADWVWETDVDGRYVYCSDRVLDVLGHPPEDVLGKTPFDFMPTDEVVRTRSIFREIMAENKPLEGLENRNITKDGREVVLLTKGIPLVDDAGNLRGYRGVNSDITEQKYNDLLQNAIADIANAALSADNLSALMREVHQVVDTLMPAKNFYIALYEEVLDLLAFPYYVDEFDETVEAEKPGRSLTSYVLRTGVPLLATPESIEALEKAGEIELVGTKGNDWLGVPFRSGDKIIGVMTVQTYDPNIRLTTEHRDTLAFIANQVATAIENKQSELELRALFAAMNDVIMVVDKDKRYLRIAPTNPSGLYRPPDELLGQRMEELLPEELANMFHSAVDQALETGRTVDIEYPLEISGEEIWFLASISKLSDDQVYWIARDISERKKAEESILRQNEYMAAAADVGRLVTSTLDLHILFDRTVNLLRERFNYYHASIFTVEEAGFNAVVRASTGEAGAEMIKRQHTLAIGSKSIVGTAMESGDPFIVNDVTVESRHHANPLLPETRAEAAIPLRVGSRINGALDLQANYTDAFTTDDVLVLQILADQVAVAIDNARSYELAQEAVREMRELDKLKSQFLANMSHELRTPLNSIIGFSRVILKGIDGPITDLQQQDLTAIYNSGQHLLGLINDILDLSKIEAGKMELSFDEINLEELIKSVMSTVLGLVKDKPVKLVQDVEPNLPTVRADPMRIRQVLINLFSNASKFTDEGSITVRAKLTKSESGRDEVLVSVIDTGAGIAKSDQSKLFQAFSQVDASATRATGGTGLGLSICQQLINMHGGQIGVDSDTGKGSTFYFSLPIFHAKPAPDEGGGGNPAEREAMDLWNNEVGRKIAKD